MKLCVIPVDGSRQDRAVFVNYGFGQSNKSPISGKPTALGVGADCLYVAYSSGTTASDSAYVGTLRLENGVPRWSMAECVIPGETVTFLKQTAPDGNPRLWIGTTDNSDGTVHLYYQSLPKYGDPEIDYLNGGPMEFAETWSWRSSRFNGGSPVDKMFRRFEVEADNLGGDRSIAVSLSAHGGTFANQGTATTSSDGRWTGTPLAGYVRTPSAQLKLDVSNSSSVPVIIRSVAARYTPRPEQTKIVTAPIVFGEGVPLKHGHGTDQQDPGVVLSTIEQFQREDPVTMIDPLGREIEAIIEPGLGEEITESEDGDGWEVRGLLRYSISRRPALWDSDLWDSGALYE